MSDMSLAPRRRPLWRLFIVPALLLIAAAAWSAFWFYAASQVDASADAWRAQEAKSGRIYDCAKRSVAGFPFRLEVRCDGASVSLNSQTAGQAAAQGADHGQARRDPGRGAGLRPETVDRRIHRPGHAFRQGRIGFDVDELEQGAIERGRFAGRAAAGLIVFDDAELDRVNGSLLTPVARAKHIELHGRLAEGSTLDRPDHRNRAEDGNGQRAGAASATCSAVRCRCADVAQRSERSFAKTLAGAFREIQAAGGHVEIVQSRIAQGDLVAVAAGTLALTARRPSRWRIADDRRRHRENNSGARHRENAG